MDLTEEQKRGIELADDVKIDFLHHTAKILRTLADKIESGKEDPFVAYLLLSKNRPGVCSYKIETNFKEE
ncbi:hypothetical protein [Pectobacterium aroidearum]|uniref:hypothetical protein n=1 Tax=Pectobacterium aroidearum TaxID=1201031 RepID=UPI001CD451C4|nr:hypothetical protein [Pectobacterium aroidearum]